MKKKLTGGINVGTSSILVTFVLLCLVTFAALSFLSANSDYKLSKQTADRTTQYYAANSMAEYYLADIEGRLSKSLKQVSSKDEYIENIPSLFADNSSLIVSSDEDTTISFDIPVNDTQNLHVMLSVNYPDDSDSALFHITNWQTQNVDIWESNDSDTIMLDDGDISFMSFE